MASSEAGYNELSSPPELTSAHILSTPRPTVAGAESGLEGQAAAQETSAGRKLCPTYLFHAVKYGQEDQKLGEVYSALAQHLHKQHADWHPSTGMQTCHLIIGESQAAGVQWAKLGMGRVKPLVNFYRGFQALCRKTLMAQSLQSHATLTATCIEHFLPKTFIFTKKIQERIEFSHEYRRRHKAGLENTWILKPSGGAHGDDIVVKDKEVDILKFLDDQQTDAGSTPWVVQKYLPNPLLLPGDRKFDVRCMVLVTHDYSVYIYSEGILRSCSVKYSLDDLSDRYAHLANHCLQVNHPDYGKHESLNLLSYADFEKFLCESGQLDAEGQQVRLASHILPQIEAQVVFSLQAVREQMEVQDSANYKCFNLLGYDFMLDDKCNVHLIEVNSSPTTDPRLIPQLVQAVVQVAVDPLFPPQLQPKHASDSNKTELDASGDAFKGTFKLIHTPGK